MRVHCPPNLTSQSIIVDHDSHLEGVPVKSAKFQTDPLPAAFVAADRFGLPSF